MTGVVNTTGARTGVIGTITQGATPSGFLSDHTGNLSGTVSAQQLYLADAFTLTGDLTVNDELVLGKITNDGTGQTLTGDGTTLTGTGTLAMGSAMTSVEGMTGAFQGSFSGDAGQRTAKAWVNFKGDGTVAIRNSFNVSSITDNDTGDYYVNFTTAMPNDDYAVATASGGSSANFTLSNAALPIGVEAIRFRIQNVYQHGSSYAFDAPHVGAIVFGDQ